jgi:hypothetical protein
MIQVNIPILAIGSLNRFLTKHFIVLKKDRLNIIITSLHVYLECPERVDPYYHYLEAKMNAMSVRNMYYLLQNKRMTSLSMRCAIKKMITSDPISTGSILDSDHVDYYLNLSNFSDYNIRLIL